MTRRNLLITILGTAAASTLVGCSGGSGSTSTNLPALSDTDATRGDVVTGRGRYDTLVFTLKVPKDNKVGERVPIFYTVENTGTKPVYYITYGLSFFRIYRGANTSSEIWDSGRGLGHGGGSGTAVLQPGEIRGGWDTQIGWNQRDLVDLPEEGNLASPGVYTIKAWLSLDKLERDGLPDQYLQLQVLEAAQFDTPEKREQLATEAIQFNIVP